MIAGDHKIIFSCFSFDIPDTPKIVVLCEYHNLCSIS